MRKLRLPAMMVATDEEYRANLTGLNTFFGAVLGFVISGVEQLDTLAFSQILIVTSGAVISILYLSASRYRLLYAATTLLIIALLPNMMPDGATIPPKLQPTLYVWTALTLLIEVFPRASRETPPASPG